MRAVVQRVKRASVEVENKTVGSIGAGLLVFLGIAPGDTDDDIAYIVKKCTGLRVFEDEAGKMNRSALDIGGSILLISQFTLHGDARKGFRPSFSSAAPPDIAIPLYEKTIAAFRELIPTETGIFGADMQVELVNDGPVTILLDSERLF
ncbi:MAG: D-tyrosyl-tRNA(Tyr) deacylase [Clostridia bacterium]|nr:D-tyrosyl-tRNA(Tyr) deacylase [Clostridia bacterium]